MCAWAPHWRCRRGTHVYYGLYSTLENTFSVKQAAVKEEADVAGPQKKEQITMLDVCHARQAVSCG